MLREAPVQEMFTDAHQAPTQTLTPISCVNTQTGHGLIKGVFTHNVLSFHPFSYSEISVHYYSTYNPGPSTKPFDIYTDASATQVGALLTQYGILVMSYLRKLTAHQQTYPALTKTLLSVFLTLQEFHSTLPPHCLHHLHPPRFTTPSILLP
jgi:hypothetical protein